MTGIQWVDSVVDELKDVACGVHDRVWREWRASFDARRGGLIEQVLLRLSQLRTQAWRERMADEPVEAGEMQAPPER
eukprot:2362021-Alexandrium_andersonii.AAC.1